MARWHVNPTKLDLTTARFVADHASPAVERPLRVLTLAADERVLLTAAAALWLASRMGSDRQRRYANHFALSIVATAALPHIAKHLVDQKRPDRMVDGNRHGIPKSGKPNDAFPSGHAMHIGAIASGVSRVSPKMAPLAWLVGGLLAGTRVMLEAHWVTDVVVGLAAGAVVERALRPFSLEHAHHREAE